MKKDAEDIKVNKRKNDKVYFESTLIQNISDGIDFLRDESREILKELDLNGIDEFDLEEFGRDTLDQIDDIVDDMSKFKSEIINSDDFPHSVKKSYRDTQMFLNRDEDYVRRARRKFNKLESDEIVDFYKTNIRVIELCSKAIEVNNTNFDAYYLKGQALVNLEEYDDAIDEFINALSVEDNTEVWLAIANANRLNYEFGDAISVYDKILSDDENSFEALKGKAYTYFDWGEYKYADEFFKKANSIEYLDEESMRTWGESLEKLG
ncbi:MAG: tetratricopeptide repeat protein [Methanobrevibacter sp.]|nr:tetratricopeptide repeat protein [Methanobrevibacter sp.]